MGYNYFRLHPKGMGLVCKRPAGLSPLTFVEEYLGEIHTPWRWFEIQVHRECKGWALFAPEWHMPGDMLCSSKQRKGRRTTGRRLHWPP